MHVQYLGNGWLVDVRFMFLMEVIFFMYVQKNFKVKRMSLGLSIWNVDYELNGFIHGYPNSNPLFILGIIWWHYALQLCCSIYFMVMGDGLDFLWFVLPLSSPPPYPIIVEYVDDFWSSIWGCVRLGLEIDPVCELVPLVVRMTSAINTTSSGMEKCHIHLEERHWSLFLWQTCPTAEL